MADLPTVPRRLVLTEAPRSSVSGADIASPYRMIGQAVGEFGAAWETANLARVEGEGAKSVVRGEDGSVSVAMRPEWSRTDQAFNRGARTAYLANLSGAARKEFSEIARRHAGDLESLNAALQSSIETHVGGVDPQLVASARDLLTGLAGQTYAGAETQFYNRENQRQLSAINAEIERLNDDMAAVARGGGTTTREYQRIHAQYRDLWQEVVDDPRFSVSQAEADLAASRAFGRDTVEGLIGQLARHDIARGPSTGSIVDRIIGAESGGDATAANPNSSALGQGQFIASTWLAMVKRDRPDLAEGRTDEEILALRTDPALSREMTERLVRDNTAALTAAGHGATAGNVYLAHFIGSAGAVGVLEAPPDTPIRDALVAGGMSEVQADAAIAANKSVLDGKTAGDVRVWARGKMGDTDDVASLIEETIWDPDLPLSVEERRRYAGYAQDEVDRLQQERVRTSKTAALDHERAIIDSASINGPMISRQQIVEDVRLMEADRNTLLAKYDSAFAEAAVTREARQRFLSPGGTFSPFDSDDRKAIDTIYRDLGGDGTALVAVVDRTGIAPPTVTKTLRGDLVSGDPVRAGAALQIATNVIAANPNAFAGQEGAEDIEKAATTFRHYVDNLGYSAEEASARIAEANTPEYQARISAKIKDEDVDEIISKQLSVGDLETAFGPASWLAAPTLGVNPQSRQGMMSDYAQLFRDRYMESGDAGLSKTLAQRQLKKVWGVSAVNGVQAIVRYPPESAPGFENVSNASDLIAAEALADIRALEVGDRFRAVLDATGLVTKGTADWTEMVQSELRLDGSVGGRQHPSLIVLRTDQGAALVSRVSETGRALTRAEVEERYRTTGEHFGIFATADDALAYGRTLVQRRAGLSGEVDRASLRLLPIPGETAAAFKSGQPVPYTLSWEDADGLRQWIPRGFFVDAQALKTRRDAAMTEERGRAFDEQEAITERMRDVIPAPRDFTEDANPSPLFGDAQ